MKDYYEMLGVSRSASDVEIRRAYRKLAHKHHPDKGGDAKKFKQVSEAYKVLSNKSKRAQYDRFGQVFEGAQAGPEQGFDFRQSAGSNNGFNFEFGDASNLNDIFSEFFGRSDLNGNRERDFRRGKDIQIDIQVDLEDIIHNQEKEIVLNEKIICSRCNGKGAEPGTSVEECFSCRGTGQVQQVRRTFFGTVTRYVVCPECGGEGTKLKSPCNVCKGEGRVQGEEKIKIVIPAGVDSSQILKVKGKGDAGKRGGKSGDLYIKILVKKHPLFRRKGDDLFFRHSVSFPEAALGSEIEINILDSKKISLKIPAGTQPGKVFRISKKGIPHFGSFGRGDLYVELEIRTPERLNKKQKELLEKLKEEES